MNEPVYECTVCHATPGRNMLTVKKVSFLEMGKGARTIKSRVTGWLCPSCVALDPEFNLDKFSTHGTQRVPVTKGHDLA